MVTLGLCQVYKVLLEYYRENKRFCDSKLKKDLVKTITVDNIDQST